MFTCANMHQSLPTCCNIAICQLWTNPFLDGVLVIFAGLPMKAFLWKQATIDISVSLWLRKQRPRFPVDKPKGYFQMKELDRTII